LDRYKNQGRRTNMRIEKWQITGLVFLAVTIYCNAVIAIMGFNEESVRILVRATARISIVLFLAAFTASSLHTFFRKPWTAWLLRNRRYIGVSFALSHTEHFFTLIALGTMFDVPFREVFRTASIIGGGIAYVLLLEMTITSFDATAKWLTRRQWTALHTFGSYYIWIIFAQSYIPRAIANPYVYAPFAIALVAALGLRIARIVRSREKKAVPAEASA
jgi:sulfoxide reductase heme-binding subunit YedZ